MSIGNLSKSATDCRRRAILDRWFEGNILEDDEPVLFGDTEMAVIDELFRQLNQGNSVFIHDPLPCDDITVAICLAYLRSQDPRFPTNGIVGRGDSLLALPALNRGYVTRFDNLTEDGLSQQTALVDRTPIQHLHEIRNERFYTAKHGYHFDQSWPIQSLGAIFIDLRKKEWGHPDRRFGEVLSLLDEATPPLIFYTDSFSPSFDPIRKRTVEMNITSRLLTTSDPERASAGTTVTAGYERLLTSSPITVKTVQFGYPEGGEVVYELLDMKKKLYQEGMVPMDVGWLFNLLTKTPVKPEYWDDIVAGNSFHPSIRELIEIDPKRGLDLDFIPVEIRDGITTDPISPDIEMDNCPADCSFVDQRNSLHSLRPRTLRQSSKAGT
jgi:hypothetical protein